MKRPGKRRRKVLQTGKTERERCACREGRGPDLGRCGAGCGSSRRLGRSAAEQGWFGCDVITPVPGLAALVNTGEFRSGRNIWRNWRERSKPRRGVRARQQNPPFVTPAKAGVHVSAGWVCQVELGAVYRQVVRCRAVVWIPVFTGMTVGGVREGRLGGRGGDHGMP